MKNTSCSVLLILLGSILLAGCINYQNFEVYDFEIHEWGVFVKGYDCGNVSVLSESPEIIYVKKPVIYFHGLKGRTNVEVEIGSIRNASTIPDAEINDDRIIWDVNVENNTVVLPNGTKHPYLFYEGEIDYPTKIIANITVIGGNVTFYVENNENYTITDIYMIYGYSINNNIPFQTGLTYVRIDELDSGEEVNITTDLKNDTSYETDELLTSLVEKGLTEKEAQELINYWEDWWFQPTNFGNYTRLIYTIPSSVYDQLLPLKVTPEPSSIVRVGIVTITNIPILDFNTHSSNNSNR